MGPRRCKWSGMGSEIKMIPGLLYQKTARAPNASQKNDSGELSLKGFRVQGSRFKGFKVQRVQGSKGSRFKGFKVQKVQGSKGSRFKGFRWRLRRILDDGIPVSPAFPSRGRCPEGADRALAAGKRVGRNISSTSFMRVPYPPLRVDLYKWRCPIKNHSRPFLWKGQTSEARRGWHPRV